MSIVNLDRLPSLDPQERRLVEAVRRACADPCEELTVLRHRVRNRAEKYRELARRVRFDGAAARIADVEARKALFEALLVEVDAATEAFDNGEGDPEG